LNAPPRIEEHFGASKFDYFSPYCDYADVDFGFVGSNDEGVQYAKLITVRRQDGANPELIRCTHWVPGVCVTFKALKDGTYGVASEGPSEIDESTLLKLHRKRNKYRKLDNLKKMDMAQAAALFSVLDLEKEGHKDLLSNAWNLRITPCRFVSPLRALPERFYSSVRKFDAQGAHFAKVWLDLTGIDDEIVERVSLFGKEANLFSSLNVKSLEAEVDDPPLLVTVRKHEKNFTLDQVGIGVSQVAPLLIDTVFSARIDYRPILSQQPELHLHPVAQAALGSYLYSAKKVGLTGIFETHSSYILDRFRSDFREDKEKVVEDGVASDFKILWCCNTGEGNAVHEISVCSDGSLKGEPDKFHEFFVDELVRTMF